MKPAPGQVWYLPELNELHVVKHVAAKARKDLFGGLIFTQYSDMIEGGCVQLLNHFSKDAVYIGEFE